VQRPSGFARRTKDSNVEDRETGAHMPEAGAPGIFPPPSSGAGSPPSGRQAAGPVREGPAEGQHPKGKARKRRKRRRGRKVFARDGLSHGSGGQSPAAVLAAEPQSTAVSAPAAIIALVPPLAEIRREPRPPHPSDLPVFAALDLGTNNCRLLVAVPGRPGQFRVIDAFSRIVRLGEGLSASGRLAAPAMDRAIEALKICADKLGNRTIRQSRLIATEACRSAANGAEFLQRVKTETGLTLEIIDRRTEARLAVSGCGSLVERDTEGVVLFDIGGGSSEIALIDVRGQRSPRLANHIVAWTSLPVGVVSLAEKFGGRDVPREVFAAMIDHVREMLDGFAGRDRLAHLVDGGKFHLLGNLRHGHDAGRRASWPRALRPPPR
jgi:exopolyphosphatase/guanosine-5'-triphosphate,3'-diphosphate pyrophosphatase